MTGKGVDLVAIGPTDNMRYLAGYASHPDERLCLLLITADDAAVVVPTLNAGEWEAHTDLPLYRWADSDGPHGGVAGGPDKSGPAAGRDTGGRRRNAGGLPAPADARHGQPETVTLAALDAPLRSAQITDEVERLQRAATQADRAMQAAVNACRPGCH